MCLFHRSDTPCLEARLGNCNSVQLAPLQFALNCSTNATSRLVPDDVLAGTAVCYTQFGYDLYTGMTSRNSTLYIGVVVLFSCHYCIQSYKRFR